MRLPGPGKGKRRDLPALLQQTPALAVIVDTFEQRTHRPGGRQRAYYSGKKKTDTLKSEVAIDEDGRVVDVGESRPGPWADLKVFRRSGLAGRLGRGGGGGVGARAVGGRGGGGGAPWLTWASTGWARGGVGPRPDASRAGGSGRRRTGATT